MWEDMKNTSDVDIQLEALGLDETSSLVVIIDDKPNSVIARSEITIADIYLLFYSS